jgi:hypothetical protein
MEYGHRFQTRIFMFKQDYEDYFGVTVDEGPFAVPLHHEEDPYCRPVNVSKTKPIDHIKKRGLNHAFNSATNIYQTTFSSIEFHAGNACTTRSWYSGPGASRPTLFFWNYAGKNTCPKSEGSPEEVVS